MNVGYLVHTFPSLSETFVLNQVTGVIDEGVQVILFPDHLGDFESVHQEVSRYNLRGSVVYRSQLSNRYMRVFDAAFGFIKGWSADPAGYGTLLKNAFGADTKRGVSFWHDVFWRGVKYSECDLFCCHHGPQGLRAVDLKRIGVDVGPIVVFIHGYDITQYVDEHGEQCYDELFDHADLLLPISRRWQKKLFQMGCPPHKVRVHRMGVDLDKFSYRARDLEKRTEPVRLVSVARLTKKKGLRYAIKAVSKLRSRGHEVIYEIIGDGKERSHLEQLIRERELQDCVRLAGKKYDQALVLALDKADIFVLPSVTTEEGDQEGLPVVLMEAAALGIPIVSTWHSGIPELIEHENNGLLVEERDVEGLASAIERYLKNPDFATRMARQARKSVERQHDVDKLNKQLVQIFSELTAST